MERAIEQESGNERARTKRGEDRRSGRDLNSGTGLVFESLIECSARQTEDFRKSRSLIIIRHCTRMSGNNRSLWSPYWLTLLTRLVRNFPRRVVRRRYFKRFRELNYQRRLRKTNGIIKPKIYPSSTPGEKRERINRARAPGIFLQISSFTRPSRGLIIINYAIIGKVTLRNSRGKFFARGETWIPDRLAWSDSFKKLRKIGRNFGKSQE